MRADRHLGFVAAAATLLAAAPLSAIFNRWTWLVQCGIAVVLIAGAALLARTVRIGPWGQALVMSGALLFALTWLFPAGGGLLSLLPTPATLGHFAELARASVHDMRTFGVPVPDAEPLLFIAVLGVGVVAIIVDLCVVGFRRPALAGLPMLAIYSVPVAVYTGSVPPVPFIIGTSGFLWLLVADNIERVRQFGRRFTGDGRGVDIWEPSPLAAAGRRLAVFGVLLAVLLPLGVPGMEHGPLSRLAGGAGYGTGRGSGGGPGQIDLFTALSGELHRSEEHDLVRVTTTDPNPYYLRFGVADQVRPDGFAVAMPSGEPVTQDLPDPSEQAVQSGLSRQRFQATVELTDDYNLPLLPIYTEPVRVTGLNSSWHYDRALQVIYATRSRARVKKYSFEYVRSGYSRALLDSAPPLEPRNSMLRFTHLPGEPIPEVDQLVRRLTAGKRTDYAKTRAIYDFFSRENGFSYQLRTEGGTRAQDIVDFLNNRKGFCQQYAAAMAWLVRAAGIPARVAVGFSNGGNRRGNTVTLTNMNLHAWTEVYFSGIGWVPFDATPAADIPGSVRPVWAPDSDAPDPVASPTAPNSAVRPDSTAGAERRDLIPRNLDEGMEGVAGPNRPTESRSPWWGLGVVFLLTGLLVAPGLRRALLRRRRQPRAAPVAGTVTGGAGSAEVPVVVDRTEADRKGAHAAWDELLDTLMDYRLRVSPGGTPRAVADELAGREFTDEPAAAEAVRLLGLAEERARYARIPLAADRLVDALPTVRHALHSRAGTRTRLTAMVLPASVLTRWRSAALEVGARLITSGGRLRDTVLRWSPRRLLADRASR